MFGAESSSFLDPAEAELSVRDRLSLRGRAPDGNFFDEERLFLRVEHLTADEQHVLPAELELIYPGSDGMSCNREKYSLPRDVCWPHWLKHHVAWISHGIVTKLSFESGDKRVYVLHPRHDPAPAHEPKQIPENYAHTLVCTMRTPHTTHEKPSAAVRKKARLDLAIQLQVLPAANRL